MNHEAEIRALTKSSDHWITQFSKMSTQCEEAWAERDRLLDGIRTLLDDIRNGGLNDCDYGGACIAGSVDRRLSGLIVPTGDTR